MRLRVGNDAFALAVSSSTDAKASGVQSVPWRRNPRRLCSRMESALLAKGVAHGVRPPPQVLQRAVLARVPEADRASPGAGDGRGGLVSGHGTRTDFLQFRTTGSAFVLILPWAAVQVIGRWRRSGQESCQGPDRFRVVPHDRPLATTSWCAGANCAGCALEGASDARPPADANRPAIRRTGASSSHPEDRGCETKAAQASDRARAGKASPGSGLDDRTCRTYGPMNPWAHVPMGACT